MVDDSGTQQVNERLFFALWPDAACREAIDRVGARWSMQCGGRRMAESTLHMTLTFMGEVAQPTLTRVREAAHGVRAAPFEFDLTQGGWWPHNRIAWLTPASPPAALTELVHALREQLVAAGLAFDARPWFPHVTVLRNARCPAALQADGVLRWRVSEFVLARSVAGASGPAYHLTGRWPLSY